MYSHRQTKCSLWPCLRDRYGMKGVEQQPQPTQYTNICMSSAEREPAENAHKAPEPSSGVLENASREYGQSISFQVSMVPEVRADSVQGLAGRGRGYPRVSSGSDTSGDTIPASGRFISTLSLYLSADLTTTRSAPASHGASLVPTTTFRGGTPTNRDQSPTPVAGPPYRNQSSKTDLLKK